MKTSSRKIVIYINYNATFDIVTQITLTTTFINKLNLKFIRAFDYIQRFNLKIRHKSSKQHIVSNVLFKLFSDNIEHKIVVDEIDDELNVLFIASLIEINEVFRKRILNDYKIDFNWQRIIDVLNNDNENVAKLFFCKKKKNDFIFRFDNVITSDYVYKSRCLCIFYSVIQNILH